MADLTVMTELEAVNEMLLSIGQSPVNSLEVTGIKDVAIARSRLNTALRQTLTRGWAFNTDNSYTFTPDVDGICILPAQAAKLRGVSDNVSIRRHPDKGLALYSNTNSSFVFEDEVTANVVWLFAFEDIPQVARDYVAVVAARRFQSKAIGSQVLDRYEEEDELKAWANLQRAERAGRQTNMFEASQGLQSFGDRSH